MTFSTEQEARDTAAKFGIRNVRIERTTHGYFAFVPKDSGRVRTCAICGEKFPEYPCNALPVVEGECCAWCDDHVVTPARIEEARRAL